MSSVTQNRLPAPIDHLLSWLMSALLISIISFAGSTFPIFYSPLSLSALVPMLDSLFSCLGQEKLVPNFSKQKANIIPLTPLKEDHPAQLFSLCFQANYGERALINFFFLLQRSCHCDPLTIGFVPFPLIYFPFISVLISHEAGSCAFWTLQAQWSLMKQGPVKLHENWLLAV